MSDTETTGSTRPVRIESREAFEELLASEPRVLVEFYTRNCSMCAAMEPVLGNVSKVSDTPIALVNGGDLFELSSDYRISSVPSLLLFEDGEEVNRLSEGFVGADGIFEFLGEDPDAI